MIAQDVIQLQLARETQMVADGAARATARDAKAAARGEPTRAERLTLEHLLPVVSGFLRKLVQSYDTGRGKRPEWLGVVNLLDVDQVAAGALRTAFAMALRQAERTRALKSFGRTLEILYCHAGLQAAARKAAQRARLKALTKARTTAQARERAILRAAAEESDHAEWAEDTLLGMGTPLMSAALSTGLFVEETFMQKGETAVILTLSEEGRAMVREVEELGLLASPLFRPMLSRPRDWEALDTGAYVSDAVRAQVPLVRTKEGAQRKLLQRGVTDGSLAPVLAALSAIQETPLRINQDAAALRNWAWEAGLDMGDHFPLRDPVAVAEVPADLEAWPIKDQRRFWAGRARALRVNAGIAPNLLSFRAVTEEAMALWDAPRFFLPCFADFRGRVNPVTAFSHHSSDATKALLEFAEGKPLGADGLWWLQVHVANCGDFEKISKKSFEARVEWTIANSDLIEATANRPAEDLRWAKADAPFSFYAACVDLYRALCSDDPAAYVSHLPVALDGSNSGVQHYSALMRAEEGAYVNLTPSAEPSDLYGVVARQVAHTAAKVGRMVARALSRSYTREELLQALDTLNGAIEEVEEPAKTLDVRLDATQKGRVRKMKTRRRLVCALIWDLEGVSRSTVKRNVMTYGYSSVAYGMGQQIQEDYMEPLSLRVLKGELPAHPFGLDDGKAAAMWMGRQVYRAVCAVLPRVAAAMEWLKATAGVLAHEAKGVLLVSPLGFPMLMKETEWETKRVELLLLDKAVPVREAGPKDRVVGDSVLRRVQCSLHTGGGKVVLKHRQQSGVAPNTIHAMDACHLHKVALAMAARGLDMLLIHDSFATHAGEVGTMREILCGQFVDLYAHFDPLQDILDRARAVLTPETAARLPELPTRGSLDLEALRQGTYAFA